MPQHRLDRHALRIARALIFIARDWHLGHLVPPGAAELSARFLYSYSPREVHRIARAQSPTFRQFLSALEYLTAPGMALHYAVRKLAIEDQVRRSIATGAQQVVVLGAGLDTLAARLHREYPQVNFIEVDRAEHQEVKRRALMGQWAASRNLVFVSADLARERLERKLLGTIYVAGAPTVFVAEGTLTAMSHTQRDALFDFVRTVGGPASSIVFTAMERGPDGRIRFRGATWLARWWWHWQGERYQWGPSRLELEDYLGRHGLRLASLLTTREFRVRYLDGNPDLPLAEGEDIVVAGA